MSYISDTIRCAEYLFDKNKHLLDLPTTSALLNEAEFRPPITNEEHDRIYKMCRDLKMTVNEVAEKTGWSRRVVRTIKSKTHKRYDPVRSEQ